MNVVSVTLTAHYNYAHGTKQPRIKHSGNDSNITGALDSPMLFNNIAIKAGAGRQHLTRNIMLVLAARNSLACH